MVLAWVLGRKVQSVAGSWCWPAAGVQLRLSVRVRGSVLHMDFSTRLTEFPLSLEARSQEEALQKGKPQCTSTYQGLTQVILAGVPWA